MVIFLHIDIFHPQPTCILIIEIFHNSALTTSDPLDVIFNQFRIFLLGQILLKKGIYFKNQVFFQIQDVLQIQVVLVFFQTQPYLVFFLKVVSNLKSRVQVHMGLHFSSHHKDQAFFFDYPQKVKYHKTIITKFYLLNKDRDFIINYIFHPIRIDYQNLFFH